MMQTRTIVDLRSVRSFERIGERIVAACRASWLVHVLVDPDPGTTAEFWSAVLDPHVKRAPVDEDVQSGQSTGGLWSTVAYDPALQNVFRHSSSAQPLHTDGAYLEKPPVVVFLACRRAAVAGGATIFLEGRHLLDEVGRREPALLEALGGQAIRFGKGASQIESPILTRDNDGPRLRWNYYAVAPGQGKAVHALVDRFHAFLGGAAVSPPLQSIRLTPGEAVFFHDHRLLHGRESFSADAMDGRFIWKGGFNL